MATACENDTFQKLVIMKNLSIRSHQVSMCQKLSPRQALSTLLRARLELWLKSATLGEPVARLHRMEELGEVLTTTLG